MRKLILIVFGFMLGLLVYYPFARYQPNQSYNLTLPNTQQIIEDLNKENGFDLKPNNNKFLLRISEQKTEHAFLYIHGFGASRYEISPVTETLAREFKFNTYFTRLTGHGFKDSDKLATATVDSWIEDAKVTLSWGLEIGKKSILIATSTGAPLALWLAQNYPESVSGIILLSPNFGPKNRLTTLLLYPGAYFYVKTLVGDYREWKPRLKEQHNYWNTRYPSKALIPMMRVVELGRSINMENIKAPTLMIYTDNDEVLSTQNMVEAFKKIGAKEKELINFKHSPGHLMAGIAAPETTQEVIEVCLKFIKYRILQ